MTDTASRSAARSRRWSRRAALAEAATRRMRACPRARRHAGRLCGRAAHLARRACAPVVATQHVTDTFSRSGRASCARRRAVAPARALAEVWDGRRRAPFSTSTATLSRHIASPTTRLASSRARCSETRSSRRVLSLDALRVKSEGRRLIRWPRRACASSAERPGADRRRRREDHHAPHLGGTTCRRRRAGSTAKQRRDGRTAVPSSSERRAGRGALLLRLRLGARSPSARHSSSSVGTGSASGWCSARGLPGDALGRGLRRRFVQSHRRGGQFAAVATAAAGGLRVGARVFALLSTACSWAATARVSSSSRRASGHCSRSAPERVRRILGIGIARHHGLGVTKLS